MYDGNRNTSNYEGLYNNMDRESDHLHIDNCSYFTLDILNIINSLLGKGHYATSLFAMKKLEGDGL